MHIGNMHIWSSIFWEKKSTHRNVLLWMDSTAGKQRMLFCSEISYLSRQIDSNAKPCCTHCIERALKKSSV